MIIKMMARAADLQLEGWAIAPPPIHQISKFGRLISHPINLGTQECNVTHTYKCICKSVSCSHENSKDYN